MSVKKGQQIEAVISDIAIGGKGLAKIDGMAVFVDQAVPLDKVVIKIIKKKKSFAQAAVVSVIEPSPFRIEPKCRYSGICGGCKFQFLDYQKQLQYKQKHVSQALEHIGLLKGIPVHQTIPSENIFEYRNKMEFSCSDRRWLLEEEMDDPQVKNDFALGLHVPGTFYKVLDINKCCLQPDTGNLILGSIREFIKNSAIPAYGLKSHQGFWRFVMLRHSAHYDNWMVNIVTAAENIKIIRSLADYLSAKHPEIVSIVNNITASKAGIAIGEYEIPIFGESYIKDKIGELEFEISANSFFQTNTKGALKLYQTIKKLADLSGKENILDLYCGIGSIGLFLADSARSVTGLEIVESAVSDANKNADRNNISNFSFICGDIKDSFVKIKEKPDVIVLDPPRAGMHKDVIKQILNINPQKIIYVSCNPAAMARDLNMLQDVYTVDQVQPVDMFPHTPHIESVALLYRKI